jgi:hypothetical protein
MAHEAEKGSKPRPPSVSQEEYDNRWDTIFGQDLKNKKVNEEVLLGKNIENCMDKVSND